MNSVTGSCANASITVAEALFDRSTCSARSAGDVASLEDAAENDVTSVEAFTDNANNDVAKGPVLDRK